MRFTCLIAATVVLMSARGTAQTPAAAPSQMVRAAGMPLQVGDLPAGTLTVRVVRGAFNENLRGRVVRLEVRGRPVQQATTDAEGRATFTAGVGSEVHATASVDGEALESERFAMPASGGVRVLLVAGGATEGPAAAAMGAPSGPLPPGHPPIDEPAPAPEAGSTPTPDGRPLVIGLLFAVMLVGLVIAVSARRRS